MSSSYLKKGAALGVAVAAGAAAGWFGRKYLGEKPFADKAFEKAESAEGDSAEEEG